MTPRRFDALRQAAKTKRRLDGEASELMLAQLIEMVRLTAFNQFDPPLTAGNLMAGGREFMPSEWANKAVDKPKRKRITMKERRRIAAQWRDYLQRMCGVES